MRAARCSYIDFLYSTVCGEAYRICFWVGMGCVLSVQSLAGWFRSVFAATRVSLLASKGGRIMIFSAAAAPVWFLELSWMSNPDTRFPLGAYWGGSGGHTCSSQKLTTGRLTRRALFCVPACRRTNELCLFLIIFLVLTPWLC